MTFIKYHQEQSLAHKLHERSCISLTKLGDEIFYTRFARVCLSTLDLTADVFFSFVSKILFFAVSWTD